MNKQELQDVAQVLLNENEDLKAEAEALRDAITSCDMEINKLTVDAYQLQQEINRLSDLCEAYYGAGVDTANALFIEKRDRILAVNGVRKITANVSGKQA